MRTVIALIVLLFATPVMAEGWICIADQASGFTYDKKAKKWKATALKTEAKYIIRRPNDGVGLLAHLRSCLRDSRCAD